jgi:hypothetical protein
MNIHVCVVEGELFADGGVELGVPRAINEPGYVSFGVGDFEGLVSIDGTCTVHEEVRGYCQRAFRGMRGV